MIHPYISRTELVLRLSTYWLKQEMGPHEERLCNLILSEFSSDLFCPPLNGHIGIYIGNYAIGKGKINNICRGIRFRAYTDTDTQ